MESVRIFWHPITHIGINSSMNYVEKKRTLMVNLIALVCIPFMLYFCCANFFNGLFPLSVINLTNAIACGITLALQHLNKLKAARIILITASYLCFTTGALLYHNSGQYYLISILIIAMLVYDNHRIHILSSFFIIAAIVFIEIFSPLIPIANLFPKSRIIFNILGSLSFILVAITFYFQIIFDKMQEIEYQRLRLFEANQDKEKIFSIIAHDIKSPFITLQSLATALREKILNKEDIEDYIDQICDKIESQNKTLDDLLNWGSINIKGSKKLPTDINLKNLTEKITQTFTDQIHEKDISVNIDINDKTLIYTNVDHLTVVLRNLISNAIKFSYINGNINIFTSEDSEKVNIHIKDHGIGMDKTKSTHLFNKIQNRSLGTSNEPGSGLGLVFCKELIEQNNGTICIESSPLKGSMFVIGFPKKQSLLTTIEKKELLTS